MTARPIKDERRASGSRPPRCSKRSSSGSAGEKPEGTDREVMYNDAKRL